MAAENGESYTPRHARGPVEPEVADEGGGSPEPTRVIGRLEPVDEEPVDEGARASGDDFDTDQMRSLSFLYGEGRAPGTSASARDAAASAGASQQRARAHEPRPDGPRHVGRTQHPADFTASKYLGDGALKGSRQRKGASRGPRHGAQDAPARAAQTRVIDETPEARGAGGTRVIERGASARKPQEGPAPTRVLPSERARAMAAADETLVMPAASAHAAPPDATRVAGGRTRAPQPSVPKKKRKAPKVIGIVVVVVVAAIAVCAGLLFKSVQQVQSDALELNKAISTIADDFRAGDLDKVAASVEAITQTADRMKAETSSPLWKAASVLPVVGDDAGNAIVLCETIDTLSDDVLVPLSRDLPRFESMDDDEKLAFAADLIAYKDKVAAARDVIGGLDKGSIDQVNSAIEKADDLLGKAEILLGG